MHEINIETTIVRKNFFYTVVTPMVLNISNEMVVRTLEPPVVPLLF